MNVLSTDLNGIFLIDGIFFYKEFRIEELYDENLENGRMLAEEQLKKRETNFFRDALAGRKNNRADLVLFGGRVVISDLGYYQDIKLKIDGIQIFLPHESYSYKSFTKEIALGIVNIINKIGVDAYMENYKSEWFKIIGSIEQDLGKLEELHRINGSLESKSADLIKNRESFNRLKSMIFCLAFWLMPGIENESVVNSFNKLELMLSIL